MSDEQLKTNDESTPMQPAQPEIMSDEQSRTIKEKILACVNQAYSAFIQSLNQLPAQEHCKNKAFGFFDDGLVWMKESVASLQFQVVQPPVQENAAQVDDKAPNVGAPDPA